MHLNQLIQHEKQTLLHPPPPPPPHPTTNHLHGKHNPRMEEAKPKTAFTSLHQHSHYLPRYYYFSDYVFNPPQSQNIYLPLHALNAVSTFLTDVTLRQVHPDAAHCLSPFASALKDVGGCMRCSDPALSSPGAKSFCFDLSSQECFPLFAKPNLSVSFSSKQPSGNTSGQSLKRMHSSIRCTRAGQDVVEAGASQILRSAEERVVRLCCFGNQKTPSFNLRTIVDMFP